MFFLFFHRVPGEKRWSFLFHPPFFSPCNYLVCSRQEQILFPAYHQHKDETKYDYLTHSLWRQLFSNHLTCSCILENMLTDKMSLSTQQNQAQELRNQDAGSKHHHK